jgi:hypothetical protein
VIRVRATKKLLDRLPLTESRSIGTLPSPLGDWYATVIFFRPQLAFLVNELTLIPVLVPLAPAVSLLDRLPGEFDAALHAFGVHEDFIKEVVDGSKQILLEKTASRSILGVMNEYVQVMKRFSFDPAHPQDRLRMAHRLGEHITSPLFDREGRPDRELMATVARWDASRTR